MTEKDIIKKDVVKLLLDKRITNKEGRHPVKIRVTYKSKQRYYTVLNNLKRGFSYTPTEFENVMNPNSRRENRDARITINTEKERAEEIIKNIPVFSFEEFSKRFTDKSGNKDVFSYFNNYITDLKEHDRIKYAVTYETTLKALKDYYKKDKLVFNDLTVKFLKDFESNLKKKKTVTTIAIHMRNIRRIFNLAIKKNDAKAELYPFGDEDSDLYQIKEERKRKKSIQKQEIKKIYDYRPLENSPEQFYKDIWMFQYLCNGINLGDVFRLKYKNIDDDGINFKRKKSERSKSLKDIYAPWLPETKEIIKRWGTTPPLSNNYVFDILNDKMTEDEKVKKINIEASKLRKGIKKIAAKVGIKNHVNNQTARHSFANVQRDAEAPLSLIQDSMGHKSATTTEIYVSDFDIEKRKKAQKNLTNWNDNENSDNIEDYKKKLSELFGTDDIEEIKKKINKKHK